MNNSTTINKLFIMIGSLTIITTSRLCFATEAGSVSMKCPQGFYVKGVTASGAKAMSMTSGGLNNGFATKDTTQCISSNGWEIALSDVKLTCFNPSTNEETSIGSVDGNEHQELVGDLEIFNDSSWVYNNSNVRELTKRDMSVQCSTGEMVEYHPDISSMDPFCQGSVEVATKPFRCIELNIDKPTSGFSLLKSEVKQIALFKLESDVLHSKVLELSDITYFAHALPISEKSIELSHVETHFNPSSLAAQFKISETDANNPDVTPILHLYSQLCTENKIGKEGFKNRDQNSSLLTIPGRKCWYPEDQIGKSKLNELTRELEAMLETINGNTYFVNAIENNMQESNWNYVNPAEAMIIKLGRNSGSREEFNEAMNFYHSPEFATKAKSILRDREHSYLEWAFRLKLYHKLFDPSKKNNTIGKTFEFAKIKMIKDILNDPNSANDLTSNSKKYLEEAGISIPN